MARKPATKPRKHASQERSRATVNALIEATARILVKEGFDKAGTNRIAETAGVSVGSLYQYFPNKEALVTAVAERHSEELMQVVRVALAEAASLPLEQAVRSLVIAAMDAHRINPALHRVLTEQMPRAGAHRNVGVLSRLLSAYLEDHRTEVRSADLGLATFVCVTSIEALTHTAVLDYSGRVSEHMFETLIDEVTRLVVRYLQ